MNINKTCLYFLFFLLVQNVHSQTKPPSWASYAIWYQIFPERFYNGDKSNDPTLKDIEVPGIGEKIPDGWTVTPWTQEWYGMEPWATSSGKPFREITQFRRYGGDLQGVLMKLDYLADLGINAIYFNPLNDAPSLHKYDARSYHHIDANFGPDPVGDRKIIAAEKFDDPSTWKWTSADKLFLKIVAECKKRHIRVIMDYSWNHTGVLFPAWQDILKNQQQSAYKDWYEILTWDDPATPSNEFSYHGWAGVKDLPELKKTDITTTRKSGYPYEGNIAEPVKQHILDVTRRWLSPDGDTAKGIDGFRLDVADQIGMNFWRDYRKFVKNIKPDAYLVGEIWWAQWPDKLMDPVPYLKGDVFDAVMFYQLYKPARYFFTRTNFPLNAGQFRDSVAALWSRIDSSCLYAMMNTSSSHDAPRLATDFYNPNKYKYHSTPNDDPGYRTNLPDENIFRRERMYLAWLFTTIGAPQIWNGEEMGMWGADDPHCRKPLIWKEFKFEPETKRNFHPGLPDKDTVVFNTRMLSWYKKLIKIRKENPELCQGRFEFVEATNNKLIYKRFDQNNTIYVMFNMDEHPQTFNLQPGMKGRDLLSTRKLDGKSFMMGPVSCLILKAEK